MSQRYKEIQERLFHHPDRFGEVLGYEVEEISPQGQALVSLQIEERHISPSGAVHGGVLSSLVDFGMGACIFGQLEQGQLCSTIEFKINYLSPVRLGEKLLCQAQTIYFGRSHAITEAEISVSERKVARAMGTYNLYRPRLEPPPGTSPDPS